MKTLFQDKTYDCKIVEDDNSKIFKLVIPGQEPISFNVDYLPAERYQWFCGVVGGQIVQATDTAKWNMERAMQEEIKKFIGIR